MSDRKRFAVGSRQYGLDPTDSRGDWAPATNLRTVICTSPHAAKALPWRKALATLHPHLAAAPVHAPGVFAGVIDDRGDVVATAFLRPDQAAIIGRHSRCQLALSAASISLRHLAVHVEQTAAGPLRTRVLDLQTALPFCTEDGEETHSVIADGPLFITLGPYSLAFVPLSAPWPRDLDEAWSAIPPRSFSNDANAAVAVAAPATERLPAPGARLTRITRIPRPTALGLHAIPPHLVFARVNIAFEGQQVTHEVSLAELRRGVLIGRYERCLADNDYPNDVSRVHLLLVAIGDAIWAIDTASTNGTTLSGAPLSCAPLGAHAQLVLAECAGVTWRTAARAAA